MALCMLANVATIINTATIGSTIRFQREHSTASIIATDILHYTFDGAGFISFVEFYKPTQELRLCYENNAWTRAEYHGEEWSGNKLVNYVEPVDFSSINLP